MNVLLLEDSGSVFSEINTSLRTEGYKVFDAYQISDAMDIIDDKNISIDFIIADLNLPVSGLTADEIDLTNGGKFAGWIWLKNYVFINDDKDWKTKTIIYSGFSSDLEREVDLNDYLGLILLDKSSKSISDVVGYLKKSINEN